MNFFEDLGTAYQGDFLDRKQAYDTFSYYTCRWWEAVKSYIDQERKLHEDDKELFNEFEKFADVMRKSGEVIDAEEMKSFLIDEQGLIS